MIKQYETHLKIKQFDQAFESSMVSIPHLKVKRVLFAQNVLLTGHQAAVLTSKFSSDGSLLASAGMDKTVMVWKASGNCQNLCVLKGHKNSILELCFSKDSNKIYTASADKTIGIFDVEAGKLSRLVKGHPSIINSISQSYCGNYLVSASDDGVLRRYDQRVKALTEKLQTKFPLTAVRVSQDGGKVAIGGVDPSVKVLDPAFSQIYQLSGHQGIITSISFTEDGHNCLTASMDQTLRIWDSRNYSNKTSRQLKVFTGQVHNSQLQLLRADISRDKVYVGSGSSDSYTYVWDAVTRKLLQRLGGQRGSVTEVSFNKEGLMSSCSSDGTIIITELPALFV